MVKIIMQPAQFQGSPGALAIWRVECLAMEALQGIESIQYKAYMWSCIEGRNPENLQNWSWMPVDMEDEEDLENAAEKYLNTEEDVQPSPADSAESNNMCRFVDLLFAGKDFLKAAVSFQTNLQQ